MKPLRELPVCGVEISQMTFPSPVMSPTPENNTVYAEYYRLTGTGPFPAVIVLDITGGDQSRSGLSPARLRRTGSPASSCRWRIMGRWPPGSKLRMLSTNIPRTMDAVRQTVLDCRYAAAWLASRPDVDDRRIGIMGTSLGSFVATLKGEMDGG